MQPKGSLGGPAALTMLSSRSQAWYNVARMRNCGDISQAEVLRGHQLTVGMAVKGVEVQLRVWYTAMK